MTNRSIENPVAIVYDYSIEYREVGVRIHAKPRACAHNGRCDDKNYATKAG